MHKITLPFLGQELEIFLANKLKPTKEYDVEEAVEKLIDFHLREFGFSSFNSELERFNFSDVGYPVQLSPLLWEYLHTNIDLTLRSEGKINAFSLDRHHLPLTQLPTAYELQPADKLVSRLLPVTFNAATLAAPFILQKLEKLLLQAGVTNFLLSYHNLHVARGGDSWEVSFSMPDSREDLRIEISDEAIYMQMMHIKPPEAPVVYNPFAAEIPTTTYNAIIVEADTALNAKLIANLAGKLSHEFQFPEFATQWKAGITLLMENGEVKQFTPHV